MELQSSPALSSSPLSSHSSPLAQSLVSYVKWAHMSATISASRARCPIKRTFFLLLLRTSALKIFPHVLRSLTVCAPHPHPSSSSPSHPTPPRSAPMLGVAVWLLLVSMLFVVGWDGGEGGHLFIYFQNALFQLS